MYISRRQFLKSAGISATFLAARFQGLPVWAGVETPPPPCFLHARSGSSSFMKSFVNQVPPGRDPFITEKYADELGTLLRSWSETLRNSAQDLRGLEAVLPRMLTASRLSKVTVIPLRVHPPVESEKVTFPGPHPLSGNDFRDDLREYLASFKTIEVVEFEIGGLDVVTSAPLHLRTRINYDLVGRIDDHRREERTGEWELDWKQDTFDKWTIQSWVAVDEQRSRLTGLGLVDITSTCFAGDRSYHEQLRHGSDYWRTVLDGACGIDIYGNNGVSVGDFDGDGLDDIYVCQPAGLPNRLYRNRGDSTFEDVTVKAGVGVLEATSSAIFADLNNNGLQDLIVVRTNGPLLFINRGDSTFEFRSDAFHFAKSPQGSFTGVAVADYDGDGLLDVYFCLYSYYQGLSENQVPRPYYDAQNGPPNVLFRNHGDGTFEDVTASSGVDQDNHRFTLACSWNDYNNDGWPDLYVINDFGRKVLYKNKGDGTFLVVSAAAGVEDAGEGMSATWLDYDNDGFDDLYVVNMWEAAGRRVTSQEQFMPKVSEDVRRVYYQDAIGNSMLHNEGNRGVFRDVTDESGTRLGGWNWGSDAWDFDHDGYPDLYVANGFISGPTKVDLSSFFWRQVVSRSLESEGSSQDYENAWGAVNELIRSDYSWSGYQRNNFYLNNQDGSFTEAAGILGLDCLEDGRSFALADIDHDGRLEVILKNRNAPQVRVFHNQLDPLGPSIAVSLKGTKSNRDAIGAVVELQTSRGRQRKSVRAGSGFLSQSTKALFFGLGLGPAQTSVRATVEWPNGLKQVFEDLSPGHRIEIEEGLAMVKAIPFGAYRAHPPSSNKPVDEDLFAASESWLVEPILVPDFHLVDVQGNLRSVRDSGNQPLLLIFWRFGCDQSQEFLRAVQKSWTEWQSSRLNVLAVRVGGKKEAPVVADQDFPFPIVIADEDTSNIYNIFYRYIYERHRDMLLPTSFLLNAKCEAIKVYSGKVDPAHILSDMISAPSSVDERLARALPFPGRYFGSGLHHNYYAYGIAFLRYGYVDQARASFEQDDCDQPIAVCRLLQPRADLSEQE